MHFVNLSSHDDNSIRQNPTTYMDKSLTTTATMSYDKISNPITFLTLPCEIRCMIYSYILIDEPITYKPRLPSFNTLKANDLIFQTQYPCYECRRWSREGICDRHEYLWYEHKGFLSTMLETTPSPYSILFTNKSICGEFLRVVYKLTPFTFELGNISTNDFTQWNVSPRVLFNIETCRFQFDMNDCSLLQVDPHHRELHVPTIAYELPSLRRMEAAMVLVPGMTDEEEEEKTVAAKDGQVEDEGDWSYNDDIDVSRRLEKRKLTNVFEIPLEQLCKAPAGQQCYLIS